MNKYRLKLGQLEFELEGEDFYIEKEREVFFEFLPSISNSLIGTSGDKIEFLGNEDEDDDFTDISIDVVPESNDKKKKKKSKSKSSNITFQMNKDLDLKPAGKMSFVEFCETKKIKTNIDFNLVSVYYMQKILESETITINEIYTCYKDVSRKLPGNLKQSLTDTASSKYGYLNTNNGAYSLSVAGENRVEFDLLLEKE